LDKVTSGFQFTVGTIGFGPSSVGLMICGGIIIIGLFSLYFSNNPRKTSTSNNRLLCWFYLHFVFLVCVIMTLLATATLLSYANLQNTVITLSDLADNILNSSFTAANNNTALVPAQFPAAQDSFNKLGISFPDFISEVNIAINNPDGDAGALEFLQSVMNVTLLAFTEFQANPDPTSLLQLDITQFLNSGPTDVITDTNTYETLIGELIQSRIDTVLWFPGVAGGALMALAILNYTKKRPEDKYAWGSVLMRFFAGFGYSLVSILDRQHDEPVYITDADGNITVPGLWAFASGPWILPSYAILLLVLIFVDAVLLFFARREHFKHEKREREEKRALKDQPELGKDDGISTPASEKMPHPMASAA